MRTAYFGRRSQRVSRFMRPATAINAASARPSSLTRANSAAFNGQRRIASDREASLAFSLPGGIPTARFHDAARSAEGESSDGALSGASADEFDERARVSGLSDDLSEQRAVDSPPPLRPVAERRHVVDLDEVAVAGHDRDGSGHADIDAENEGLAHWSNPPVGLRPITCSAKIDRSMTGSPPRRALRICGLPLTETTSPAFIAARTVCASLSKARIDQTSVDSLPSRARTLA